MNTSSQNVDSLQDPLFRVLLVEDELDVLNDLILILGKVLPRSEIHAAENVRAGHSRIESSSQRQLRYDIALLDFKLPPERGMQEEFDFSLCAAVRKMRVPVIHFSAFGADETIIRHMKECHDGEPLLAVPAVMVRKTATPEWTKELIGLIQPYFQRIVNERICERLTCLTSLFMSSGGDSTAAAYAGRVATPSRSASHGLLALKSDILELWPFLGPDAKDQVRSVFSVVEPRDKPRRLSLF